MVAVPIRVCKIIALAIFGSLFLVPFVSSAAINPTGDSAVSGFYGGDTLGSGLQGIVASMCQSEPWANNFLADIIPPSFFDGLCQWQGYQVGAPAAPPPQVTLQQQVAPISAPTPAPAQTPAPAPRTDQSASNASVSENVPFDILGGDQCYMFFQLLPKEVEGNHYVALPLKLAINNEEDYRKLFDPKLLRLSCAQADVSKLIPNVDFSKQTVLAFWASGACSDTGFKRKVSRDDISKQIIYTVTMVGSVRFCTGPGPESLNLIAIPKVPAGYDVIFEGARE